MRYFTFEDAVGNLVTMSEDEVRRLWWPIWYRQMCDKYEQAYVDEYFCFQDALDDWILINRAVESVI